MILRPKILKSVIPPRNQALEILESRHKVFASSFKKTGAGRVVADLSTGVADVMCGVMEKRTA